MASFSTEVLRRVAHDVKNPLTAVRVLADLLAEDATGEQRTDLLALVAAIDVAVVHTDGLGTYARALDGIGVGGVQASLSECVASTVQREAFRNVRVEGASDEQVERERVRRALATVLSMSTHLTRGPVELTVHGRSLEIQHPGIRLRPEQVEALFTVAPTRRIVRSTAFGLWLARDLLGDAAVQVDATQDLVVRLTV